MSELSIVTEPSAADVAIELAICGVLPSRMRLRIAEVTIMSSHAATLPPVFFGRSCCERTAISVVDSCILICFCLISGKTETIRSIESGAELVCRVAKTR